MTLPIVTCDKPTKIQMKLTWSLSIWKQKNAWTQTKKQNKCINENM
jgi:hypothetical protein